MLQLTVPVELAIFLSQPLWPLLPVIRVGHSPILGRKGLGLGVVVGPVVLEAGFREEVLVGLSSIRGEYSDRSAHPRSEKGIRSHNDEAFDTLLLHQALHFNDLLGFSGLSLIAMGRDICHALAGEIGPPAQTVRHGVVLSRNINNRKVELGQGFMPSCPSGGGTRGCVHVLLVPRLQTLMVGADGDGMEGYVPSPFPESG